MKPGTTISHYQILEEIGRGGMGVVYRAEDTKLRRIVALKLLSTHLLGNESDRARFYREARAAAGLQHPNIATVHEIDEDGDHVFIALEFIDGKTIDELILDGPLSLKQAIDIAIQAADGLQVAHERNIVHRDMKSGNVMVTKKGTVKVLDFGLAKTAASTKLTQYGSTLGTVAYMSPEQARGEDVDPRTDLWSLGAVIYEMVAGSTPFPGDYEQAVVYGILNNESKPLTSIRTGVPMELERIVNKCMQKDIGLRYQHADDLIADLKAVNLAAVNQQTRIDVPHSSTSEHPEMGVSRGWFAWAALAGLLGLALGWLIWHSDGQAPPRVVSINRVTAEAELELQPAISPDGSMIAYIWGSRSNGRLFVRQIAGGSPIDVVPGMSGALNQPSWSKDGTQIAFAREETIYSVPALGGTAVPLTESTEASDGWFRSPTWRPSSNTLAVAREDSLYFVDVGNSALELRNVIEEPHTMAWSYDGAMIAGTSQNVGWNLITGNFANVANSKIWVLNVDTGNLTFVSDSTQMNVSPAWGPNREGIYYVSGSGGGNDIYYVRLDDDGKASGWPRRVTVGLGAHTISSDATGMKIAVSRLTIRRNAWRIRLSGSGTVSVRDAEQVTFGSNMIEAVDISSDGSRLAFDSGVSGNQDIYLLRIGEPEQVRLTSDVANDFLSTWWPDQRHLAVYSMRNGKRELFMLDSETTRIQPIGSTLDHETQHPHVSNDERRIVYRGFGSDSGVGAHLWTMERTDQGWQPPAMLSGDISGAPRWSPDATLIAYVDDNDRLMLLDPVAEESRPVVDREGLSTQHVRWSADGQTLFFYAMDDDGKFALYSVPLDGGEPRRLMNFDDPHRTFAYHYFAIHEDYVYFTLEEADSDIWVLELE